MTPIRIGNGPGLRRDDDLADLPGGADRPGIEAQAVDAVLEAGQGQAVVEMDVGDERNGGPLLDPAEGVGRLPVGDGQPDDLAAGLFEPPDLGQRRPDVARVGLGHGLDRDRRAAPDGDRADLERDGRPARRTPRRSVLRPIHRNDPPRTATGSSSPWGSRLTMSFRMRKTMQNDEDDEPDLHPDLAGLGAEVAAEDPLDDQDEELAAVEDGDRERG